MSGLDWNVVYPQMLPRVRSVVCAVLRDKHEAEDAVQETFVRAMRSVGSLRDPAAFSGWLLVIARRTAVSRCRRLMRVLQVSEEDADPVDCREGLPSDAVEVAEALARLPLGAQRVLNMKASGRTVEQIAAIDGITAAAARMRLHRARVRLKELLS
ncbi:MAG: ECF RNA polymerase sigma factor SigE [Planctomycetes bacterium]|nr:ECF RNA polymerase sigma factor SigE [Planctomycetota bacterium]